MYVKLNKNISNNSELYIIARLSIWEFSSYSQRLRVLRLTDDLFDPMESIHSLNLARMWRSNRQ